MVHILRARDAVALKPAPAGVSVGPVLRAAAGGAPAWSPADETGLWTLWLDPSDASTRWADTTATTAASVDGLVARIDDKSGGGRHFTQATSGARPLLKSATGLNWLEGDGVDDFMESTANISTIYSATALTCIIGMRAISAGTNDSTYINSTIIGDTSAWVHLGQIKTAGSGQIGYAIYDGTWKADNAGQATGSDAVLSVRVGSGQIRLAVNGGAESDVACSPLPASQWSTFNVTPRLLGGALAANFANARVYGVLIANTDIGTEIRDKAVAWMAAKAGVTL